MKKSFALLAAGAALCVSTSASALNFTVPLGTIRITGTAISLSSAGGQILPLGASGSYCGYLFEWLNPQNAQDLELCRIVETKSFGQTCAYNSLHDVNTNVDSVGGQCQGYNAAGASLSTTLHLTEFSGGVRMQGVAMQGGVPFPVRFS